MSDLFYINEIANDEDLKSSQPGSYTSDSNNLFSINLFIKALNKALNKVNESVEILAKINPSSTIYERNVDETKLLVEFVTNLDLVGKILDEFQKGTSILNENSEELVDLFTALNDAFSATKLKISIFSISKDIKYANESIETLNRLLKLFENMKEAIISST